MRSAHMGLPSEDIVVISSAQKAGDPTLITVNCLDKLGLCCDLTRTLFDFGLAIDRADISTDGQWCFLLFWVTPQDGAVDNIDWSALKKNLISVCPSGRPQMLLPPPPQEKAKKVYILQTSSGDRPGLLNEIARTFCEIKLVVQKMKATTTPDGKALNLFYLSDSRELLHEKRRQDDVCLRVLAILDDYESTCMLKLAGPEWGDLDCSSSSIPSTFAENLSNQELSGTNKLYLNIDNSLSRKHTLLQIPCKNRKGLLYDSMRTMKDFQMQVAYARISTNGKGSAEVELFISHKDGKKVIDPQKQENLCRRLELEILQPVKILTMSRGPDTELLVAAPTEICGQGRPRVLYDVTCAIKALGISIFKADIQHYSHGDRHWEIFRFLFMDKCELDLSSQHVQETISQQVRSTLMG